MLLHPLSVLQKVSVFFLVYLIAMTASAQVFNSSISSATGGTGRAAIEASDAAFMNSASLVHLKGLFLDVSMAENEFAAIVTDNSPLSFLPSAVGFVQKKSDVSQGELKMQDITLSLAEFVVDRWAMGITGHYYNFNLPGNSYRQVNGDLGVLYTPRADIGLALVGYNIFGEQSTIPSNIRPKFSVGAGLNYIYMSRIRFRADITSESVFMGGLESYLNDFIIIRLGYQKDTDDDRDLATAGFGFKGPRFALNYAYQGNPQNSGDYRHSVDLQIPF